MLEELPVLYGRSLLFTCFIYNGVFTLIPDSQFIPCHLQVHVFKTVQSSELTTVYTCESTTTVKMWNISIPERVYIFFRGEVTCFPLSLAFSPGHLGSSQFSSFTNL